MESLRDPRASRTLQGPKARASGYPWGLLGPMGLRVAKVIATVKLGFCSGSVTRLNPSLVPRAQKECNVRKEHATHAQRRLSLCNACKMDMQRAQRTRTGHATRRKGAQRPCSARKRHAKRLCSVHKGTQRTAQGLCVPFACVARSFVCLSTRCTAYAYCLCALHDLCVRFSRVASLRRVAHAFCVPFASVASLIPVNPSQTLT